jgi:Trypsin
MLGPLPTTLRIMVAALIVVVGAVTTCLADGTCKADPSPIKYDAETENCYKAFCELPETDRLGRISNVAFSEHVKANKEIFRRYDQACFKPWAKLQDYSKAFLSDVYGALFLQTQNGLVLTCSAFRISQDTIVTARHCLYGDSALIPAVSRFSFRSIASPADEIKVVGEIKNPSNVPKTKVANDFGDYWYLKLAKNDLPFHAGKDNFRSTLIQRRGLLIAGINRVSFVLDANEDPEKWATSFRFTPVSGAAWLPKEELPAPPPSLSALARCIYYKAPSFTGMSGSPIIGADFDQSLGRPTSLFVVGIHLRSGIPEAPYEFDSDCGAYPDLNIGLALPDHTMQLINSTTSTEGAMSR